MANPSISIDDEVLDDFDEIRKAKEESLGASVSISRSAVIQELMEEWIAENEEFLESGNSKPRLTVAD